MALVTLFAAKGLAYDREILRFAQNDKQEAQNDKQDAQVDRQDAQVDREDAQVDSQHSIPVRS